MSINTLPFSEELSQRARDYLDGRSDDIERIVDTNNQDYQTVKTTILMEYFNLNKAQAKKLLEQIYSKPSESSKQIQTVESSVMEILENPHDNLMEEFISVYENFCKDYNINTNTSVPNIPKNLRDTIIFEFPVL